MIYVTGDTHIPIDIRKLSTHKFPEQFNMNKSDYVIVCGDFGGVWNANEEELYWRNWLNEKNFTTLFVDGNHENFELLNGYKVEQWNGGKVHKITDSIIHLMRGQVYTIEEIKIFTFGGATSTDKEFRKEGKSWWAQEIASEEEKVEGLKNLEASGWKVDYVITHTCAESILEKYINMSGRSRYPIDCPIEEFLEGMENKLDYKQWYFGHFHDNFEVDKKHTLLYGEIIKI